MLPMTDASSAFAGDPMMPGRRRDRSVGLGPALGLWLASMSSVALWGALVHITRWAAHTLF